MCLMGAGGDGRVPSHRLTSPHRAHPWQRCWLCSAASSNSAVLRASRCLKQSTLQESSTILAIQRQAGFFAKRFQSKLSVGSNFSCAECGGWWGGGCICCWGSVGSSPSLKRSVSLPGSGFIGTCLLHHLLLLSGAGSGEVLVRSSAWSR